MSILSISENIIKEKKLRKKKLKQRVAAVIQARMGSSRLPGKVLMNVGNKPTIQHLIERIQRSSTITDIIVATTTEFPDKKIADFCRETLHCGVYKGSEWNVLDRVCNAAAMAKLENTLVVDITADCPLVDPFHIDMMVNCLKKYKLDYVSNTMTRSWPDGFDIQVYTKALLEKTNKLVANTTHRSHTGWNIVNYSHLFYPHGIKMMNIPAPIKYCYPEWGLTLDTKEDHELLTHIFNRFKDNSFTAEQVIEYLLQNKHLLEINNSIKRNIPGRG